MLPTVLQMSCIALARPNIRYLRINFCKEQYSFHLGQSKGINHRFVESLLFRLLKLGSFNIHEVASRLLFRSTLALSQFSCVRFCRPDPFSFFSSAFSHSLFFPSYNRFLLFCFRRPLRTFVIELRCCECRARTVHA